MSSFETLQKKFFDTIPSEQILRKFEIDGFVERQKHTLGKMVAENIDFIIKLLYDSILSDKDIRDTHFSDKSLITKVQKVNSRSIVSMFNDPINDQYIRDRLKIGFVHYELKVGPLPFLGATSQLMNTVFDLIRSELADREAHNAMIITSRLMALTNFLVTQAFHEAAQAEIRKQLADTRNLIRIVTHDINNPITVAHFNAKELTKEIEVETVKKAEKIRHGTRQVMEIVQNVKDSLVLVSETANFPEEHVDLQEVRTELQKLFVDRYEQKGVHFNITSSLPNDCQILIPRTIFIHSILGNLISNALKFTPKGGQVSLTVSGDDDLIFRIKDSGIGIPEDLIDVLFSPDNRANRKGTDGEKGTGFGMPLVKGYVEKIGGRIEITSVTGDLENTGTTVTLTLDQAKIKKVKEAS